VSALALSFATGWASGVNAYLVVLVLGIADRVGALAAVPDVLARWDVLAAAAALYAVEFVADKIPYVDSAWDVISTAIRPTVGAVIGVLLAGEADSLSGAVTGTVGGTSALVAHLTKAGTRLAINASPEPFTNIAVSLTEDAAVLGVVWFALEHPRAAAGIAGVLMALGLVILYLAAKLIRRGWRRLRRRTAERSVGPPTGATP
jgi:hypothetical protein